MAKCFRCKNELSPTNRSIEHIIPNALGGMLKSYHLLCTACNSEFGKNLDSYLAKNIPFPVLLNIERDDKEPPYPIRGYDEQGQEYNIRYNQEADRLEVERRVGKPKEEDLPDGRKRIVFTSEKQGRQILSNIEKKDSNFDKEKAWKNIKWDEPTERVIKYYEEQLEGELASRALTKIAVGFFIHSGGNMNAVLHLLEYIQGETSKVYSGSTYYYYPPDDEVFISEGDDEVSHTLYVRGDSISGVLLCYIELFSIYQFIVILSREYQGDNFDKLYCYDILKNKDISTSKTITLPSPDPVDFKYSREEMLQKFNSKKERVYKITKLK